MIQMQQIVHRTNRLLLRPFLRQFSSVKEQYSKTYLLKILYKDSQDAYYQTYDHRQQFRKDLEQYLESEKSNCYVFGGDQFPMESTTLVVNCNGSEKGSALDTFLQNNIYNKKGLIRDVEIEEMDKISETKFNKLSYFYQYK